MPLKFVKDKVTTENAVKANSAIDFDKKAREHLSVVIEYSGLTLNECRFISSVITGLTILKNQQ